MPVKWMGAVAMLLLLSGCWDTKDINHRSLPIAMGVAYHEGKYTVYLDIPKVSEKEQGIQIVSAEGQTINEVIDHISMNMESQVDLLHLKVIIVDKAFAEHGLLDGVSSFIRSRHIAPKATMAICDEPLDRFFDNIDKHSGADGISLYDFFQKDAGWTVNVAYTPIWTVFRSIHSYTHDVIMPIIQSGDTTVLESKGSAIMKNGKMVGRLSDKETLLVNVFTGHSAHGKIEVMGHSTVQIVSSRISQRSSFDRKRPRLRSTIHLKVIVLDSKEGDPTMRIRSELQQLMQKRFQNLFRQLQTAEADVLGLGQLFRNDLTRRQLAEWRTDYLPNLQIDVRVKTVIRNTGNLKSP